MKATLIFTSLSCMSLILLSYVGAPFTLAATPKDRAVSTSLVVPASGTPSNLSDAQFEQALKNISTAPNYVLITVIDSNTGSQEKVCLEAVALLSAVSMEQKLGWKETMQFARKQKDRVFRFSKAESLKLVSRSYTDAILADARNFLSNMTMDEIDNATRDQKSKLYQFFRREPGSFRARFPAIAHVLTERGILCARGCKPGLFYIDRSSHNKPDAGDGK